jgi:hypothetical protein
MPAIITSSSGRCGSASLSPALVRQGLNHFPTRRERADPRLDTVGGGRLGRDVGPVPDPPAKAL